MSPVSITNGILTAHIAPLGAELVRLQDARGRDWLWDGDPAFWKGRAPLLFPIVGRVRDDRITVDGQHYPMKQHGLARMSTFAVATVAPDRCVMELAADATTRETFPFRFLLSVSFTLADTTLRVAATVRNDDAKTMPASFGFHPAFRWPLPGAAGKAGHSLRFDRPEPAPIWRLQDGLLTDARVPTPVDGTVLSLEDALFAQDALVFDEPVSRGVTYAGSTGESLRVDFPDMPQLGVWTKPGAGFLCIEPWYGYASPVGFDGEFAQKPGVVLIPPGAEHNFAMALTLSA